ncbi:uncharacterized protein Z520_07189 [Fonsecaea multimorphosa CBS 102226]|uniref:Fumarylacetoacetase-like C-terminal domain-containing protein n=1 Tax=Fonsecaea multimorphosa CBS 102226 TaxID=1442371 RepID=A0A0D2H5F0_9EURO|nr:uncharacterized protein Z520_07189 [Fonsecaea multimorphosa CBS 102226]KIX97075.1 hypothetical protein Z520_07189 [Fonsecaea multimorphosa CBS 102226]OAL22851.1 hypothetical protein AYO22_06759 [Fonsecaea multimorphosa]
MPRFERLVRFRDSQGQIQQGEASKISWDSELVGKVVPIYKGTNPWDDDFHLTEQTATISEVLSPLASVPMIDGIGLNYREHAKEGNMPIPPYPVVFVKYPDALAGPFEDIPIHKDATLLDYEGELCVVIERDVKDLSPDDDPIEYVLGYTAGNDVSSRFWQGQNQGGGQHGYAKSFDKFAPLGPVLVSRHVIKDPGSMHLKTWVNGDLRQNGRTDDLIFDVPTIIRHLSRGMTLRKGTVIMTGTPSGVGIVRNPPAPLQDGDIVEVEISEIGRIRNKMVFIK